MSKLEATRRGVLRGLLAAIAAPLAPGLVRAARLIPIKRRIYYPLPFLPFGVGQWQWAGVDPESFPLPGDDIEERIRVAMADLIETPTYLHVADINSVDLEKFGRQLDAITPKDLLDDKLSRAALAELFGE